MKIDVNTNSILNEVMSNSNPAVLVLAPPEYNKVDFITELSNRYHTVYWFNALTDDLELLCESLITKILADEPKLQYRLRQLLFCNSRYNGIDVIINSILDYIAKQKQEVLMIFERMERLRPDYDYSHYCFLIKHAPANLKIVISSDTFLALRLYRFEPQYPMLIDENSLRKSEDCFTLEDYISDITPEEIAFLTYIADLPMISSELANSIYPKGDNILRYLSRKGTYVITRDVQFYRANKVLKDYLASVRDKYAQYLGDYVNVSAADRFMDDCFDHHRYYGMLRYAYKQNRLADFERAMVAIFNSKEYLMDALNFVDSHPEINFKGYGDLAEYPYCRLFKAAIRAWNRATRDHAELIEETRKLEEYFDGKHKTTYYACKLLEYMLLLSQGKSEDVFADIDRLNSERPEDSNLIIIVQGLLPSFIKYARFTTGDVEAMLKQEGIQENFWYIKLLEDLELTYFDGGNYRKALATARRIKEIIPQYVIPLRLVAMNYFSGNVEESERVLNDALDFAIKNELKSDIGILYSGKAFVEMYYGREREALELLDKGFEHIGDDCTEKYFTIMVRAILKARMGETEYARDLSHIYLRYCRACCPQYAKGPLIGYAFANYLIGERERAYQAATSAIQESNGKSYAWMIGMGIAANYLIGKGDLRDIAKLVGNIIKASSSFGMIMAIVDNANDIFAPLLSYARENNIEPEVVAEIDAAIEKKLAGQTSVSNIKISMFGDVSITVGGEEIQWKTRKSKDLFLHYVLAGDLGIDRNIIIDFLWKDYLYESAINNLKTTNNIIRKTLVAHNVDFQLEYINSKYVLRIKNLENDYTRYKNLMLQFNKETLLDKRTELMNAILKIYKSDFAVDVPYADFTHERTSIKQELIINLLKLVRLLAKSGEYLEAKHFLSSLIIIDKQNDYAHLVAELDRFINIT